MLVMVLNLDIEDALPKESQDLPHAKKAEKEKLDWAKHFEGLTDKECW